MENNGYSSADLVIEFTEPQSKQHIRKQSYLQQDLQKQILRIIGQNQKKQLKNSQILSAITDDLEILCRNLQEDIQSKNEEETLKVRMHQLAINKILVLTHGKTDFRLIVSHFQIGKAYVEYGCFEQAINHLTIASTKISKLSDIKQTKIYNSCILTALSKCYYMIESYEYSLEILNRAYDIQNSNQNQKNSYVAKQTLERLAMCYLKLKNNKESVKIIDKLIDIMNLQFTELESLYKKLTAIVNASTDRAEIEISSRDMRTTGPIRSRNNSSVQLCKVLQFLSEKLDFVIIEYNKLSLKQLLSHLLKEQDLSKNITLVETLVSSVGEIITGLVQEVKKQRIFKFKIFVEEEAINNSIDQELKSFLREYDDEKDNPESFKKLTRAETIEIYKLLIHYCSRFFDHENQLVYLRKLEEIYLEEQPTMQSKINLLKVKRNLSMIYYQRHMQKNTEETLEEIKNLEVEVYGNISEAVKKTMKMIKMIRLSENKMEEENLLKQGSQSHIEGRTPNKSKLRKTIVGNNSTSNHSISSISGKLGKNRLIL